MGKKILITGSTGFIGRHLVEYLGKKYTVYAPVHKELNLLDASAVTGFFQSHAVDVVLHTALYIGPTKFKFGPDMLRKNLHIFFNMVENLKKHHKMLFFGSGAEYNIARPLVRVAEDEFGKSLPHDDYGTFKYTVSKYIEHVDNIVNLRLFGVYGKYEDHTRRPISNVIYQSLLGLPIIITQNVSYDYLYANDLVQIVQWFIENDNLKHKYYNVCTGKSIDLLTVAKKVLKVTGKRLTIKVEKKGLKNEYSGNNKRLLDEMGGFKFTPIETAIKELYEWQSRNKKRL